MYSFTVNINEMKIYRPKTERWHNYSEGDCGSPIQRHGEHLNYYKKGFWKRNDRKKYFRKLLNKLKDE